MQHIRHTEVEHICRAAARSHGLRLDFDPAREGFIGATGGEVPVPASPVQKVARRTVVSLQHGRFHACEIIRQQMHKADPAIERSALLQNIAAPGGRYAFDLISHVGVESYLRGRSLQDIRQELIDRTPTFNIPISSLLDQQQKFLFYLGHLHAQAAPLLRQCLVKHGSVTMLDGTIEPGTPVCNVHPQVHPIPQG